MKGLSPIKGENKTNDLINIFIKEILKFNKAHNIVGRTSEEEIISLDVLDCETVWSTLTLAKVLDIGSAGLPGPIIAINQPKTQITMSEKTKESLFY